MSNRRDRDMTNEKLQAMLADMLKDEDNKYCADCDAKGPRWASWNLGVFLCIRCAGIHRNLGVHISRVKSVNLDTWTPEQLAMMQEIGNSRGRAIYEANLPDNFRRPQNDMAVEQLIRSKYEEKRYIAKEWVPPKPHSLTLSTGDEKRSSGSGSNTGRRRGGGKPVVDLTRPPNNAAVPRPGSKSHPPGRAIRNVPESRNAEPPPPPPPPEPSHTEDLLGLEVDPSKKPESNGAPSDDLFGEFLSKPPAASTSADNLFSQGAASGLEKDFFEQSAAEATTADKAEPPKSTKESILALYGSQPSLASMPPTSAAPNQFLGMPPSQVPTRGCPVQNLAAYPTPEVPVYGMLHASASAPHMGSLGFNAAAANGSPSGMMGYPAPGNMWPQQGFQAPPQSQPQPPAQQPQPHAQAAYFASGNVNGPSAQAGMFGVQHNPFFAQQRQAQMQQQQQQQQQMYLQQVQQQLSGLQIGHPPSAAATTAPPQAGQTLATDLWQ